MRELRFPFTFVKPYRRIKLMAKTKIRKNSWWMLNKYHNLQVSWYKLFVEKKQIPVERLMEIMMKFRAEVILPECTSNNERRRYDLHRPQCKTAILVYIRDNFSKFIPFITKETGVQFKTNTHKQRIEERLDAEFADRQLDYMMNGGLVDDL